MEGERLGRVVAVTLPAWLTPLACTAFGVGNPAASGPVTDEAFLITARQTVRWAIPAGRQAEEQADNAELKDLGRGLAEDLTTLDDEAGATATRLELTLPDQANEEQQGWPAQLDGLSGADFDLAFVNRLRGALGELFLVAAHTAPRPGTTRSARSHP